MIADLIDNQLRSQLIRGKTQTPGYLSGKFAVGHVENAIIKIPGLETGFIQQ